MSTSNLNFNKSNYDSNGFCVVKKLIDKKILVKIKKELAYIIKNNLNLRDRDLNLINNNEVNSMHGLTRYSNFFKSFSENKKIKLITHELLKKTPKFREAEYFAKPKLLGLASPYHQDNFYWNIKGGNGLTVWIAIDDASKRNGSIKYLKGSHKLGTIKHINSFAPGSSQKIPEKKVRLLKKKYNEITVNLKSGDALFHHCEIVHGSERNNSKFSRRGLTLQFQAWGTKKDFKGYKKYLKNLHLQIKLRKR